MILRGTDGEIEFLKGSKTWEGNTLGDCLALEQATLTLNPDIVEEVETGGFRASALLLECRSSSPELLLEV